MNPQAHALCAVCRGHAGPHGYSPPRSRSVIHACDIPACIALLPKVYAMPKSTFDAYEEKAIREGGDAAWGYLESTTKTSFYEFTEPEWREFCKRFEVGRQSALRRMIEQGEAPF